MKGKSVTFRPKADMRARLEKLAAATERPLTYYIEKAIEAHMPALEEKYAEELSELQAKRIEYKLTNERGFAAERTPKKKAK